MSNINVKKIIQNGVIGVSSLAIIAGTGGVAIAQRGHNEDGNRDRNNRNSSQQERRGDNQRSSWWKWWNNNHNNDNDAEEVKACEERQSEVESAINSFRDKKTQADARLDIYYAGQKAIVEGGITAENSVKLIEKADAAAATSDQALSELNVPQIDCEKNEKNDDKLVKKAQEPVKKSLENYRNQSGKLAFAIWQATRL